jgi:hypothetical protein
MFFLFMYVKSTYAMHWVTTGFFTPVGGGFRTVSSLLKIFL